MQLKTLVSAPPRGASVPRLGRASALARDADDPWLYRLGAVAALLTFLIVLVDIAVTMLPGDTDTEPAALGATGWFALLQEKPLLGLRNLGLLNVFNLALSLPLFAVLVAAQRRTTRHLAGLAILVQLVGSAVYIANNAALPMLDLSGRYAAAASEEERAICLAAGQALLARGEDFTPGAYLGFLLPSLGSMLMAAALILGGVFHRATGWAGLVGTLCMLSFTTWATFVPTGFSLAMPIAAVGGLLSLAWYALLARNLLRVARKP